MVRFQHNLGSRISPRGKSANKLYMSRPCVCTVCLLSVRWNDSHTATCYYQPVACPVLPKLVNRTTIYLVIHQCIPCPYKRSVLHFFLLMHLNLGCDVALNHVHKLLLLFLCEVYFRVLYYLLCVHVYLFPHQGCTYLLLL